MGDQKDKALKSIFKGGAIVFVGTIISKFISLLFRILVGQTGVSEYGEISVMIAVFTTSMLFAKLGVDNGVQRFMAYYLGCDEREKAIGSFQTGTKMITISSVLTAILLFISAPWLANQIFNNSNLTLLIKLVSLCIPFRAYASLGMHATDALGKMEYSTFNDKIIVNITQFGLAFLLLSLGYSYIGVAVAYVVTFILGGFIAFYFAYREFPELMKTNPAFSNYDELIHHSLPLIMAGVFTQITGQIDTFMIQALISSESVGLYQSAFPFASSLTVGAGMFGTIFLSNASELISKGQKDTLRSTYRVVVKWTSITMIPIFLIAFVFPRTLLTLFGSEYYEAANILRILSVGFLIKGLVGPAENIYQAIEKTRFNLYTTAIIGISNLILNILLIPSIGVLGAAWASSIALTIGSLANIYIVYRITGKQPFRKSILKIWFSGLLAITLTYLITNHLFSYTPTWFFPIALTIFGLSYLIAILLLNTIENEDLLIMKAIRDKTNMDLEKTEKIIRKLI